MRIAFVNPISQTSPSRWKVPRVVSNAQSITVQLARGVACRGHDVTVYMADPYRPEASDEGVKVCYLPTADSLITPAAQLPYMPTLSSEVRAGGFDAVVASEMFQWSTLDLSVSRAIPQLFVWHEADAYQRFLGTVPARAYYMTAGRIVARAASGFFPRSDRARDFLRRVGVPDSKIGPEVPNGIDSTLFTARPSLRSDQPTILFVGSLIERKNPSLAVRAMPLVLTAVPEARLIMKGFGEQEGALRTLSRGLGVSDSVVFDTKRSSLGEMARLYNSAWVCVFPSFRDFASLSPIEAVACGVPVVLSKRLFSAGYLEASGCGIASSDDPVDFADAVIRQVSRGPSGLAPELISPVVGRFAISSASETLISHLEEQLR